MSGLGNAQRAALARGLADLPNSAVSDRLAAAPVEARFEVITEARRIAAGSQVLDLVPVAGNPHAEGLLVTSLPNLGALFVSDIVTPGSPGGYPLPSYAALDRFFSTWLASYGLQAATVWSMHGSEPVTSAQLAPLRDPPEGE